VPSKRVFSATIWVSVAVILGAATWVYVMVAWPSSAERFSDLYPRWYGSRELLLRHRDPYSPEVSREIQLWLHNRPAQAGEDEGRFAYPLYVSFLLAPSVTSDFSTVNKIIFWAILCSAALSSLGYFKFVRWAPPNWASLAIVLFTLGYFPVVFSARARQLAPLVSLLLAASLLCIMRRRLAWAGILLALATIKPQLTVLAVPWLVLWSFGDWQRRRGLLFGLAGAAIVLFGGSELLLRGWIGEFIGSAIAYSHYTDGRSVLQLFLTREGGALASVLVVAALAVLCWRFRRAEPDSIEFIFTTALVLATTLIVIPTMAPHGQVLLIPAILFLLRDRQAIVAAGGAARYAWMAACILVAWQWAAAIFFSLAAAFLGTTDAHHYWLVPLYASAVVPVGVAAALATAARPMLQSQKTSLHSQP
jgi:hypothetical protein